MHALLSAQSCNTTESRDAGGEISWAAFSWIRRSDLPRNDNYFRRSRRRRNARLTHAWARYWNSCVGTVAVTLLGTSPSSDNTKRVEKNVFATKQLCLRSPRPYLRHWREGLIVNCIFSFSQSRLSFNRTPFGCKRFAGCYIRWYNEQGSCIACDCSTVSKKPYFCDDWVTDEWIIKESFLYS